VIQYVMTFVKPVKVSLTFIYYAPIYIKLLIQVWQPGQVFKSEKRCLMSKIHLGDGSALVDGRSHSSGGRSQF